MDQHFETVYSDADSFEEKLAISDERARQFYIPALQKAGFSLNYLSADTEIFHVAESQKENWIDELPRGGIRLADLRCEGNKFISIEGTDTKTVFFEVKDYAQENKRLQTGAPYKLIRRYIAIQHLHEYPVIMLFADNKEQETGGERFSDYSYCSAYKDQNGFIPYGGLLFDLFLKPGESYKPQGNNKFEIRWSAQQDREGKMPQMKTVEQISALLSSGKIQKIKGDPNELPLWQLIQRKADEGFGKRLIEPKGGLIYFKTKD